MVNVHVGAAPMPSMLAAWVPPWIISSTTTNQSCSFFLCWWGLWWTHCVCPPGPHSHDEALTPRVMGLRKGASGMSLGGDEVMGVELP